MLTGIEQRAAQAARLEARARRKEANRARYFRYMRRLRPRFGAGKNADPLLHYLVYGSVVVSRGALSFDHIKPRFLWAFQKRVRRASRRTRSP